ncbi:MAG TPA: hypothetical protein VGQ83_34040 [Polyangia bacterium]|jgi:hypothetical protein
MGLRVSARVSVEVREVAARPDPQRRFRLSRALGPDELELERAVGFAPGQPVLLRFRLPATAERLEITGVVASPADDEGPRLVRFPDIDPDLRRRLVAYLEERLGLT